jgi:hypothetical protein
LDNSKNKTYCVFPTIFKIKNHGYDGSGENCDNSNSDLFRNQVIDYFDHFEFLKPVQKNDLGIDNVLRKYFRLSTKGKYKGLIYTMIFF